MKIFKLLLPFVAFAILAVGCNTANNNITDPEPGPEPGPVAAGVIADFFPFHENALITFELLGGWGGPTAFYYTISTEGDKMQRLIIQGDFRVAEVFEISDGELRVNHAGLMVSGFENLLNIKDEVPMVILKEPLVLGNSWKTHTGPTIQGVAGGTSTITAVDVEIEIPNGTASAIEVSTEYENGFMEVNYFAKGLGLVKSGHFLPGFEVERDSGILFMEEMNTDMTLISISENTPLNVEVLVFHPNDEADDLDFVQSAAPFMTNGDIRTVLEAVLRNPGSRPNGIISPNTAINFIDVSREVSPENPTEEIATVHLDLTGNFSEDMNVGISYEQLILAALEKTFLEFYNAEEFILSVDGLPHVSIH